MDSTALREGLHRLAMNHRWTWTPSCRELLLSLPGAIPDVHPVVVVSRLSADQLDALLADTVFMTRYSEEIEDLDRAVGDPRPPLIAYCSPEFGISALVPQYSGGLGILAGDHLKAASEMDLPLVGVGLFYRHGYFKQVIVDGAQTETYLDFEAGHIGAEDTGSTVSVPFPGREVVARIWRMMVGRINFLLLDTHVEANSDQDRLICDRLYGGDRQHRLDQEMVLGVGGARAVRALGWEVPVHHLNEGHAGFILLDLIDDEIDGGDLAGAIERVRPGLVFTTHTPVPAGIDRFDRGLITPYLETWATRWQVPVDDIWSLGEDPEDPGQFNMAALTLRNASAANGVSRLHGEVSRRLFDGVGIGSEIGSVTNGVHARTWVGDAAQEVFDRVLGPTWSDGDPEAWDRVGSIDDTLLGEIRARSAGHLATLMARRTGRDLDPRSLVIGFARRFAPYKRATLLLHDPERLMALLSDDERPIHFVFAGKAHPRDGMGKELVAEIVAQSMSPDAHRRFTFIPAYDMEVGAAMVEGCDIWLNNPIRPREASGTSGEKAALNGALNCSILDGWWAEMYDGKNGWAIEASEQGDPEMRDREEAASLLDMVEAIRDEYFGARHDFHERIRHAWRTLGPRVTAARMLAEYQDGIYLPALRRTDSLA
ncbi:MAG: alpha-glucan family phosphorylase [Acidimicrobiia bacterium]